MKTDRKTVEKVEVEEVNVEVEVQVVEVKVMVEYTEDKMVLPGNTLLFWEVDIE